MQLWPRRKSKPQVHVAPRIEFLCEQDGPVEQQLKEAVAGELRRSAIQAAYLARVVYDDPDVYEVALCLRGPEDRKLVERIGVQFAKLFGKSAHMDVLFLTDAQEEKVKAVCAPFYRAG